MSYWCSSDTITLIWVTIGEWEKEIKRNIEKRGRKGGHVSKLGLNWVTLEDLLIYQRN